MYLVICKNKHGLSITASREARGEAEYLANVLNNKGSFGNTYHVRPFDLASIDLDRLMEGDNA